MDRGLEGSRRQRRVAEQHEAFQRRLMAAGPVAGAGRRKQGARLDWYRRPPLSGMPLFGVMLAAILTGSVTMRAMARARL